MVDPWTVLGWILVFLISVVTVAVLIQIPIMAIKNTKRFVGHLKSRNVKPEAGQRWDQGDIIILVRGYDDKNRIRLYSWAYYGKEWVETREQWERRVRKNRMFLLD